MSVTHRLKTLPDYWDAIERGEKNFDVRRDDRGFQKGDTLELVKLRKGAGDSWVQDRECVITRKITYILTGGQLGVEPGYVVMGLKK